mmetsp:Transcript_5246/g.11784  ORF Transcript_5246/g.11784 Transcript_5246/m.11784 type:complete len:430 (+) Transcript_5246:2613-3902(+)
MPLHRFRKAVHATITAPIYLAFKCRPNSAIALVDVFFEVVLMCDVVLHFQKGVLDPESSKRVQKFKVSFTHWFRSLRVVYDFMTAFPVRIIWLTLTRVGVFNRHRPGDSWFQWFLAMKLPPFVMMMIQATTNHDPKNVMVDAERSVEEVMARFIDPAVQQVFRLIYQFFLFVHFLACGYNVVCHDHNPGGEIDLDGRGWSEYSIESDSVGRRNSLFARWTATFYFALSAVSGEYLTPETDSEIGYNTVCLVCGVVINAVIIGSVASLLAASDTQAAELKRRREHMSKFMRDHKVPTALSDSILQYYAYLWGSSSSYTGLWDDLSPSLRTSLNAAVMNRCLSKCPLFEDLSSAFLVSLSNLLADNSITLIPDEILFDEGDEGTAMFFVPPPPPSPARVPTLSPPFLLLFLPLIPVHLSQRHKYEGESWRD